MKQFSRLGADATAVNIAVTAALQSAIAANADFCIGMIVTMNGDMTIAVGAPAQASPWHTGGYQESGGLYPSFYALDNSSTTLAGKVSWNIMGSSSNNCTSTIALEGGKSYYIGIERASNTWKSKIAEVTAVQPTNGAAVLASTGYTDSSGGNAFTFPKGFNVGYSNTANRRWDHAISRLFVMPRVLTDFEIAQISWGKEVTAFGTPLIYLRMNDATDTANTGSLAANAPATSTGTLSAPDPAFGYSSVPTAPSFPTKPVISGAAVVGQSVGYTGGEANGNPSPTITRQWFTSTTSGGTKTAIAGATGATYTLAAGDAGKFLHLTLTADNDVEPNATSTSDPVLVSSTAVDLTLTSIQPERMYQRLAGGPNGQAVVPLSGGFVGAAPAKVEAQLYDVSGLVILRPWFDVAATFGASTWSADPTIDAPQLGTEYAGQKYRIAVRSKNAAGSVLVTAPASGRFGVGDKLVIIGSSSPATWSSSGSGSSRTPDHNKLSEYDAGWKLFGEYGQASLMAQYFTDRTGVPTAVANIALGGSSLSQWSDESSTLQGNLRALLAGAFGQKIWGLFGSAGSNDITSAAAAPTVQAHLDKLNLVRDLIRRDTGQPNLPILWSGINRRYDALPLPANNARQAEREFGEQENIYYVQTLDIEVKDPNDPVDPGDGVHPTGTGYATCCRRIEYVWSEGVIYGRKQRGPVITGISFLGSKATITIAYRNTGATDMTGMTRARSYGENVPATPVPVSQLTGIEVTDDDGQGGRIDIPILSIERADPTRFTITCDRTLVNPKITYLEGAWVNNDVALFDNAPTGLPLMADPIGLAGNGAVFIPVSNTLSLSWSIAPAAGTGTPQQQDYTVSNTMTITYDIAAEPVSTGPSSFVASKERTVKVEAGDRAMSTTGKYFNVTNPKQPKGVKDPNETIDYSFDWSPWLADATDSIASYTFTLSGGLSKVGEGKSAEMPTVFVSGGALGAATITCRIVTKSTPPRTAERTVQLTIEER